MRMLNKNSSHVLVFVRSLFLVAISGCLLFSNFIGLSGVKALSNQSRKAELQREKKELAEELRKANAEVSKEAQNKESLDKKISIVKNQIDVSNNYINSLDGEIMTLRDQIDEKQEDMDKKIVNLKKSLVSIYKAGDTSTVDIILGSKDFEDFVDKVDIAKSISKSVKNRIDDLKSDQSIIEEKKQEINKTKIDQEQERENLKKSRAGLQVLVNKSEKLLGELKDEEKQVKDRIDQNDSQIKAIDAQIERYYAEQKKKEEAAKSAAAAAGRTCTPAPPASSGKYMWPLPGYYTITSGFYDTYLRSRPHGAIDISGAGVYGARIVASASGKVIFTNTAGRGGGYGLYVIIDHGNGVSTLYAHMSSVAVSVGQNVSQGQTIGNVGNTGISTNPHLHFEYRVNGVRRNPREIV
ncbi:MAG: peptidoglycan DD-metalloendopeptidase family protein [Clostridia bacterium]|nr:peptidoglycan DD-metalloendopeptidase family protein [Clostridia bacterium]